MNAICSVLGFGYWSLPEFLKRKVKDAEFIGNYEECVAKAAGKYGVDGVICGHIHNLGDSPFQGIDYFNCGDWVESCSALVEHLDGAMEIIRWFDKNRKRMRKTSPFWKSRAQFPQQIESSRPITVFTRRPPIPRGRFFLSNITEVYQFSFGSLIPLWRGFNCALTPMSVEMHVYNDIEEVVTMLPTPSSKEGEVAEDMSPKKSADETLFEDIPKLDDPRLYLNREINWIDFNSKVLEEAIDLSTPMLEQLKFLSIFFNNLDEFFMVRVSALLEQGTSQRRLPLAPDGMSPSKQLALIRKRVLPPIAAAQEYWSKSFALPAGRRIAFLVEYEDLGDKHKKFSKGTSKRDRSILTPQAIDPGRPFPVISNLSLNFLVQLADPQKGTRFARIKVPKNLSRFIFLPRNKEAKSYESLGFSPNARQCDVLFVENLVAQHLGLLFPGLQVTASTTFRITRNTDVEIEEDESSDLLEAVKDLVDRRNFGEVVRLEVSSGVPKDIFLFLVRNFRLAPFQIYKRKGPLDFAGMMDLCSVDRPDLKDEPLLPRTPPPFSERAPLYSVLRKHDAVLYHPYDSFAPVLDFVRRAAVDPKVVAIKQTLYRVGNESPVVDALMNGPQERETGIAVVELKARFDEERNINWAEALEDGGPRGLRPRRLQNPREDCPRDPARKRWRQALRAHRHRKLQPLHGEGLLRPGALHRGQGHLRGRHRPFQRHHRLLAQGGLPPASRLPAHNPERHRRAGRPRDRAA